MDSIQGHVGFDVAPDGTVAVSVDQQPVATIGRADETDTDRTVPVYMADGKRWTVHSTVPRMLAEALENDAAPSPTAVSPFGVPVWPSGVVSDSGQLASADTGVSPMTFAPVAVTIQSEDSAYSLTAGPGWKSWTLADGEGSVASISATDGIAAGIDRQVPLPALMLAAAIVLGVAAESHGPTFMTAKRREGKAEQKFVKKYGSDIDAARATHHDPQYMQAWDQRSDLYSWIECLTCGDRASTFGDLGGSMTTSMFFGKALGQLKGPLLDESCPGHRKI
jgi:hypothetical protein